MNMANNKFISINNIINEPQDNLKICTNVYTDAFMSSHYHQINLQLLQISS